MKYISVITRLIVLLGFIFMLFPSHAVASNAESEVSIRFSEWADEPTQETIDSSDNPASNNDGSLNLQTGEIHNYLFGLIGILFVIFILFILYKRSKEGANK